MLAWIQLRYKAIAGGVVASLTSLVTALGDNSISPQEWITALIAGIVASGVVYSIPNIKNKLQSTPTTGGPSAT